MIPVAKSWPPFPWREMLGEVPVNTANPGETKNSHPLSRALNNPEHRGRALHIIEQAVELAEGQSHVLAAMFECHYHTARRFMVEADRVDRAAELRFQHRHAGPTGFGIQPRSSKPRTKPKKPKKPKKKRGE